MASRGTVLGLDRVNGLASVQLPGRANPLAATILGEPPCPRSRCFVEQVEESQWIVLGSEGSTRLVFHEDFQMVAAPITIGLIPFALCDQMWTVRMSTAATFSENLFPLTGFDQRSGQIGITSPNGVFQNTTIARASTNTAWSPGGGQLWMHTVAAVHDSTELVFKLGWGDATNSCTWASPVAGMREIAILYDSTTLQAWKFRCVLDAGSTQVDTSATVVVDRAYDFDIVVQPGQWAALWIDGGLAAEIVTNIPGTGTAMTPMTGCLTVGAPRSAIVDCITVSHVRGPLAIV